MDFGRGTRIALLAVGVGVGAFGIGYIVTALAFSRGGPAVRIVTVPDVREMPGDEARRVLRQSGLEIEIGDSIPHPETPTGYVLAQSPLPGREVGLGSDVRVILSLGRPQPQVPEVEAMPLALATRSLQAVGFDVEIEEVPSELPVGRVVEVDPPVGARIRLPALVTLRVSGGPEIVSVPALLGLREDVARETLEALGLRLGDIEYEPIDFGDEGYILDQRPAAGDSVEVGGAVRVRVSARRATSAPRPRPGGRTAAIDHVLNPAES